MDYGYGVYQGTSLQEYLHILLKTQVVGYRHLLNRFSGRSVLHLNRTPIFRTSATLQITQDNPGSQVTMDDKLSKLTGSDSLEKFQQTQYNILQSWSLAQRVVQALNLKENPDFKSIREQEPGITDPEIEDAITGLVQKKLRSPRSKIHSW